MVLSSVDPPASRPPPYKSFAPPPVFNMAFISPIRGFLSGHFGINLNYALNSISKSSSTCFARSYGSSPDLMSAAIQEAATKTASDGSENKKIKSKVFSTGNFRVSPRKLTQLSHMMGNMSMNEAIKQMEMCLKKPTIRVGGLLKRASKTWEHNYGGDASKLYIKKAWVGKGGKLKRVLIHGRGRHGIMHHPYAHMKIEVAEKENPDAKKTEIEKLVTSFKSKKLFIPLKENKSLRFSLPPWSRKPWKYVTSPKWMSPDNALHRKIEQ